MIPQSTATTRIDAILRNLNNIRARIGTRMILAPVQANAFGHGVIPLARAIEQRHAAEWFGVSSVAEGVELRRAGITLPILVLAVTRGPDVIDGVAADLTLTVADADSINEAGKAAADLGRQVNVQLKIDTGLRRAGCSPRDATQLAALAAIMPRMRIRGVWSTLTSADTPAQDEHTAKQIAAFTRAALNVETVTGPIIKHLAGSGGVLAQPDSWLDLVRPGVLMYGSYPDATAPRTVSVRPGIEWVTRVTDLREVDAGETVGFGRTWAKAEDTWIATIPVGYADGYSRLLSNRGRVLIGGRSYPIAGRVGMNQTAIDVGRRPTVRLGDPVVLIGRVGDEDVSPAELASLMTTTPAEVTCLIGNRVARTVVI